jgi:hypothetical protein
LKLKEKTNQFLYLLFGTQKFMGGQTPFGGPMHIMSEGLHMVGQVGGQTLLGSETIES